MPSRDLGARARRAFALLLCAACLAPATAGAQVPELPRVPDPPVSVPEVVPDVVPEDPVGAVGGTVPGAPPSESPSPNGGGSASSPPENGAGGSSGGSGSPGGGIGGDPARDRGSSRGDAERGRGSGRARDGETERRTDRARSGDSASTRERTPRAADDEGSSSSGDDSIVPQALRDAIEVIPAPIRLLLALVTLIALALGARSVLLGARARRLEREREDLRRDVGLLQSALLPELPEQLAGGSVSAAYRPAAGLAAGGDFFDAFPMTGGRLGLIVGDVCGHGRESLEQTALVRYTLRAYLEAGLEPRGALALAGEALGDKLRVPFATVVVATYDPVAGTLTYSSAGHPHPILLGLGARQPVLAFGSPPIGMGGPTGRRQTTIPLPAPSVACLYTDGLVEARVDGELLGEERLAQLLSGLGPHATAAQLLERVAEVADELSDDMAACVFRPGENGFSTGDWTEELEADALELLGPHLERFLAACELPADEISGACSSLTAAAEETGTALIRVQCRDGELSWDVSVTRDEAATSVLTPAG